jgi:hypothetical protein
MRRSCVRPTDVATQETRTRREEPLERGSSFASGESSYFLALASERSRYWRLVLGSRVFLRSEEPGGRLDPQ